MTARAKERSRWTLIVLAALAFVPVRGLFSADRVFFVRDLGLFFWSRHLWLRHTIFSGRLPLWDPYAAAGHAAYADALNQIFMPVTLALRLLPSDVLSFNLWVALPLPVASIGTFLFLRRRHAAEASALGACAFALSGAVVSSLNAPNLSWSLAFLPWVCLAGERVVDDPGPRAAALLAIAFALQALSGEPVTLAASVVVLLGRTWAGAREAKESRLRRVAGWACVGLACGVGLSAIQMLPTTAAGVVADRASWSDTPDFWSLHPLALLEAVVPHLFGDYYTAFLADVPWMARLNSGREPFFYSIYAGPLLLLLACAAAAARPRRARMWVALAVLFVAAAMGSYTPFYPLVRRVLPPLAYFRFPIKYIAIAFFALAALAAEGWDALIAGEAGRRRIARTAIAAGITAAVAGAVAIAAAAAPAASFRAAHRLAIHLQLADPNPGAAFLVHTGIPLLARAAGLLLAGSALLAVAAGAPGRRSRAAAACFLALTVGDLLAAGWSLNPTMSAAKMNPPAWYTKLASSQRVYVGGRLRGFMDADDPDGSTAWDIPAEPTAIAGRIVLNAELPMASSGFRVREAATYDLPVLLPSEYAAAMRRFLRSTEDERAAFLRRSGVRWSVLPEDTPAAGDLTASVPDWHMIVVDRDPLATRAFITFAADAEQNPIARADALFDASAAETVLRVAAVPPAAGRAGSAADTSVAFAADEANRVELTASLPRDGFVVLRDSFDPGWRATVDDEPAIVVRANQLYRAVHVAAGRHVIRFEYRPRMLLAGLTLSVMSAIAVGLFFAAPRKSRRTSSAGFTLVELMIVLAIIGILLAIAFARYRGMQARANETSAYASLRTIAAAQWTFAQTCGNQKYAATLPALAQPIPATGQGFLSPDLTSAEQVPHSGYLFQMAAKPIDGAPGSCSGVPVASGYAVTADPLRPGATGTRFFAVNTDRVIYADEKQTFTGDMPENGPPAHGVEVKGSP